jgi:CO dehydrogenase maturation factor
LSFNISVAGKGGSGKTSLACLIIRYLIKAGDGPLLAVDADPNSNLGESLGLDIGQTIGSTIASFNTEKIKIPSGMTKQAYLEYTLNQAVVESKGIDLITMGRGEGPECYCYPNLMLRKFVDSLSDSYSYVVTDNEAGMEHLSRRTAQRIDALLITSDHSVKGVRTIARIGGLVEELGLRVRKQSAVISFVPNGLDPRIGEELSRLGIEPAAIIPYDEEVRQYDIEQKSLLELPDTSRAVMAVDDLMAKIVK